MENNTDDGPVVHVINLSLSESLGMYVNPDASVSEVVIGGQTDILGIHNGDQIIEANNVPIDSLVGLKEIIALCKNRGDTHMAIKYFKPEPLSTFFDHQTVLPDKPKEIIETINEHEIKNEFQDHSVHKTNIEIKPVIERDSSFGIAFDEVLQEDESIQTKDSNPQVVKALEEAAMIRAKAIEDAERIRSEASREALLILKRAKENSPIKASDREEETKKRKENEERIAQQLIEEETKKRKENEDRIAQQLIEEETKKRKENEERIARQLIEEETKKMKENEERIAQQLIEEKRLKELEVKEQQEKDRIELERVDKVKIQKNNEEMIMLKKEEEELKIKEEDFLIKEKEKLDQIKLIEEQEKVKIEEERIQQIYLNEEKDRILRLNEEKSEKLKLLEIERNKEIKEKELLKQFKLESDLRIKKQMEKEKFQNFQIQIQEKANEWLKESHIKLEKEAQLWLENQKKRAELEYQSRLIIKENDKNNESILNRDEKFKTCEYEINDINVEISPKKSSPPNNKKIFEENNIEIRKKNDLKFNNIKDIEEAEKRILFQIESVEKLENEKLLTKNQQNIIQTSNLKNKNSIVTNLQNEILLNRKQNEIIKSSPSHIQQINKVISLNESIPNMKTLLNDEIEEVLESENIQIGLDSPNQIKAKDINLEKVKDDENVIIVEENEINSNQNKVVEDDTSHVEDTFKKNNDVEVDEEDIDEEDIELGDEVDDSDDDGDESESSDVEEDIVPIRDSPNRQSASPTPQSVLQPPQSNPNSDRSLENSSRITNLENQFNTTIHSKTISRTYHEFSSPRSNINSKHSNHFDKTPTTAHYYSPIHEQHQHKDEEEMQSNLKKSNLDLKKHEEILSGFEDLNHDIERWRGRAHQILLEEVDTMVPKLDFNTQNDIKFPNISNNENNIISSKPFIDIENNGHRTTVVNVGGFPAIVEIMTSPAKRWICEEDSRLRQKFAHLESRVKAIETNSHLHSSNKLINLPKVYEINHNNKYKNDDDSYNSDYSHESPNQSVYNNSHDMKYEISNHIHRNINDVEDFEPIDPSPMKMKKVKKKKIKKKKKMKSPENPFKIGNGKNGNKVNPPDMIQMKKKKDLEKELDDLIYNSRPSAAEIAEMHRLHYLENQRHNRNRTKGLNAFK